MPTKKTKPQPKLNPLQWYRERVTECTDTAWRLMMQDPTTRLYLWHRQGALLVSAEQPAGCELSNPEHLPGHITKDRLYGWIEDRTGRVPCLPIESQPQ